MRVLVYRNINKGCWSIKALDGQDKGRVIAHRHCLSLRNIRLWISENGRQRVLRERRKNVHAGIIGTISNKRTHGTTVSYNPYRGRRFFEISSGRQIRKLEWEFAYFQKDGKVLIS